MIDWGRQATNGDRLVLAAKTAVAAAIAWYLAPLVPWADSEYSYYAPLGVLVSMYPTVVGSVRAGLQALVGLAIGIALGLGGLVLVSTGAPGVIAVAAVIAVGIALGGISALGAGRDWVAIAGLFVLLIGGPAGDEFTLSYLLTMAFGVVVGVAMNLIVVPPLYLRRASEQLTSLRERVSGTLEELAGAVMADPIDPRRITDATSDLPTMLSTVEEEVQQADESSRANPRGRRRRGERELNDRRMTALERTANATRDLAAALVQVADEGIVPDAAIRHALGRAVHACAEIVGAATDDQRAEEKAAGAAEALDALLDELNRHPTPNSRYTAAYAYAAAVCVRRIVLASEDFIAA
ncbi:FUSC family protein [Microbacterium abyssi]|uniref:FUSC family protein n=1 Tax=Microbacterium abyssi TaxID=2782166 RepID=UPI0018898549|nr:FUSC family protein [Microbacterium sp. A18JL241]